MPSKNKKSFIFLLLSFIFHLVAKKLTPLSLIRLRKSIHEISFGRDLLLFISWLQWNGKNVVQLLLKESWELSVFNLWMLQCLVRLLEEFWRILPWLARLPEINFFGLMGILALRILDPHFGPLLKVAIHGYITNQCGPSGRIAIEIFWETIGFCIVLGQGLGVELVLQSNW